jgi:protein-tyrosine kinase
MAKFSHSQPAAIDTPIVEAETESLEAGRALPPGELHDRSIGAIIREIRNLTAEDVEKILRYQRERNVRFGEAAIALGLATSEDVLQALSQQFHYPVAAEERRKLNPELVTLNQPFSNQAEAFRAIRSQVMMKLFNEREPRRAIAVISPDLGDGKTFFAANLAITLAQLGGKTLLVDADLRGPRIHEVFNIGNTSGLTGILSGRAESQVIQQVVDIPTLFILPAGSTPPNPIELIERPAFGLLLRELMGKFDYVVIDTPAAVYGADALAISAKCGAALMVARKDSARVAAMQDMVAAMSETPARLAGVVMNDY